ncbi:MAG: hypothetical protein K2X87_23735 [Gemmataceae bacterium]|nr:hypothetical protein [Gemmataceae bacterium]
MDPAPFLNLADALVRQYPIPAGFRTAVSRAYYAAHLTAREFLFRSAGVVTRDHGIVWGCLHDTGHAGLDEVGRVLKHLHGFRVEADDKLAGCSFDGPNPTEIAAAVQGLLDAARNVIATLAAVRADAGRLARAVPAVRGRHKTLEGT